MESLTTLARLPFTRREMLFGSSALGLSFLLPAMDLRTAERRGDERLKSLIVLWMAGGPSQLETWDPHPNSEIGGPTKAIPTAIQGLQIADTYPRMAERIAHLNVIRSLTSKEGDHERGTYMLKTGYRPDPTTQHPSLGAILCEELPNNKLQIPPHVSLGEGQWPARGGYLGAKYDAFRIYDPGKGMSNVKPPVADERQQRRLQNLDVVSRTFQRRRHTAAQQTQHRKTIENALTMMSSAQLAAFELNGEPQATLDKYGDTRFGRGCLVARRLIETGVRAVEVSLTGFDTHADNFEGHKIQAEQLDPAFAALVDDLVERDLLQSTVVLCVGEFGRTPNINPLDGRDHWPNGFSCVLGGGGLRSGVVIGETAPTKDKKDPTDPVPVEDLFATVLQTLGVDHEKELITPIGRPMALSPGNVIDRLM